MTSFLAIRRNNLYQFKKSPLSPYEEHETSMETHQKHPRKIYKPLKKKTVVRKQLPADVKRYDDIIYQAHSALPPCLFPASLQPLLLPTPNKLTFAVYDS